MTAKKKQDKKTKKLIDEFQEVDDAVAKALQFWFAKWAEKEGKK